MSAKGHVIRFVEPGSIAEELELVPGDVLLSVNGQEIEDVLDYQFLIHDEFLNVQIQRFDGEVWELEIEKDYDEDLGIGFDSALMDDYRSCSNDCIFCFIDQMPKGMRDTLYFKDDDSRLSFLQGNYVTLTNMSDHDIDRIIRYHLEPINISIHTTNPDLRCRMLRNRFAGDIFPKVKRLFDAGILMNAQIVLCKGINDKKELDDSIAGLEKYIPFMQSVSVVPVGLTRFRDGLYPLEAFDSDEAASVIDQIEGWQDRFYREYKTHFVHASDEWYILAGRDFPEEERYDGYLQLENGVGMMRLFTQEINRALSKVPRSLNPKAREVSIATGELAGKFLRQFCENISGMFPQIRCHIYEIRNDFFGERITVAGLLTGTDLTAQLQGKELGEELLLSCDMLKSGEQIFLDDMTLGDLSGILKTPVRIVGSGGEEFVRAVLGLEE